MFNTTEITPIKTVQEEPDEGVKFTIEGIVTSNASGYDKDTAFFDCIYLQDETAGINAFPVAGNFKIGDKVRITGTTSSYQGERQIAVTSIAKLGEGEAPAPKAVTAAQLENKGFLGSLVTVEGTATKIEHSNGRIRDRADVVCTAGETPVKTWNIFYFTDGGVINGDYPTTYDEGTVTVLPTDVTKDGYTFLGWFTAAEGGDKVTQIEAAETGDKEFFAHWQKNETPVKTWNIFYFTDGGVINGVYPTTYVEGKGAKLPTSVTKKGYTFLGWFTKDGVRITRIGADATGDVTVYAHWTLDALYPSVLDAIFGGMDFSDVSPRDWFYKDVEYVYEKGIMDGIDKHTFAPDANLTRGMLVTILYRIEGEPVTRGSTDFTDVELGRWYTKAVAWAASKDIVNGYGGGKFGPNDHSVPLHRVQGREHRGILRQPEPLQGRCVCFELRSRCGKLGRRRGHHQRLRRPVHAEEQRHARTGRGDHPSLSGRLSSKPNRIICIPPRREPSRRGIAKASAAVCRTCWRTTPKRRTGRRAAASASNILRSRS